MIRKYLVKLYPVYPTDKLEVIDLEGLRPIFDKQNRNDFIYEAQCLYTEYICGCQRYDQEEGELIHYNNSLICVIDAHNALEAVHLFMKKLKEKENE